MIRLIQRRLIVPRGDTGTFSIPVLAGKDSGDASIFTVFSPLTHRKIFEKVMENSDGVLKMDLTHGDTVNLPVGEYVWDIKFYTDPVFVDEKLVSGTEVDSYYSAFQLPICEIRETGDNLLMADDAPDSKLAPDQINYIDAAIAEIHNSMDAAVSSAAEADTSATNAESSASAAAASEAAAQDSQEAALASQRAAQAAATDAANSAATASQKAAQIEADLANKADKSEIPTLVSQLQNDVGYLNQETDPTVPAWAKAQTKPTYTAQEVGALPSDTFIPSRVSDLTDDSGHYTKPASGIPASDLEETYLTSFTETDPTVPNWAKQAQKPSYTAQEVGALPADTVIPTVPTNVSAFTNDAGYITGYTETDPTVPAWAKAAQKPSYTAAEVGAPTVQEMNTAIGNAIGNINSFDMAVVQELPSQDISTHTIYLVPKTGETNDVYDEYVYINNAWEMVGNTQIDLSNYALKSELPTKVSELNNDSGYLTSYTETDPTVPQWAKASTKPSYTAMEVGALPSDTHIPSTTAELTNDAGFITSSALPTKVSDLTNDAGYLTTHQDISGKANTADLATVATSGSYNDLSNKPTIPSVPVQDVQINGTSVVTNGIANIPITSSQNPGVMTIGADYGITLSGNRAVLSKATDAQIKAGTQTYKPIVSSNQHQAVFYGLTKAAGVDMSSSSNAVGTYTDAAKVAIRSMLGATSSNVIAVQDEQPTDSDTKVWLPETEAAGIEVPTYAEFTSGLATKVGFTNYANNSTGGVVKVDPDNTILSIDANGKIYALAASDANCKSGSANFRIIAPSNQHYAVFYGLSKAAGVDLKNETVTVGTYSATASAAIRSMLGAVGASDVATATTFGLVKVNASMSYGMALDSNGILRVNRASSEQVKEGAVYYMPLVPYTQHESVFYGLSKVAGVDLANETVTLGTYPATASTAIRNMIGAIGDVQVNGTSIVSNGVANIPMASSSNVGVVQTNATKGTQISEGTLATAAANDVEIKGGAIYYRPIIPARQHQAVFYGLAKAAGDTTMSSSSNEVGTYTDEAKAAIHTMLGIDPASIAAQVDIPLVETVSGTTPTITGQPNVRYVCGEISTLTITPPASGSVDIIFESGSTPTTLTVPNTVKWPVWFDATALEAETTYEILITDSKYGAVMTWAT